ncbi:MAG TPA: leucine--tRNA ligase [Flavobacteriaceae bacterium]|nr:leucine--tRNA ligase [Flavobacteriaceae bacterium]
MNYDFNKIEAKWQKYWAENQTFNAENNSDKEKFYCLDMFPYPSGAGLHVGHPLGYIASDIVSRYKRHKGFNVLHPMGYDSFGLPAEQYAIQTGQHPAVTTKENIARYRQQMDKIGFSFDWSREVRTSDPDYYKWTQWIFIKLFESWYDKTQDKARDIQELVSIFSSEGNTNVNAVCDLPPNPSEGGGVFTAQEWKTFSEEKQQEILLKYRLTYLAETEVNWCPALGTVLANDEIVNGVSERGGHPVERKKMKQWSMRISAYAERLLQGLEKIDWTESLKETQRNWIGKSVGAEIQFRIQNSEFRIGVFSTRPDTIFGTTFMTLAPEHELVSKITTSEQKEEVEAYIKQTAKRSERERMADVKSITGVFTGAYAEHPFTKEPIPIWIGDYVLAGYGTGAVMAVPCGDQRDYDFTKHFDLPIKNIFEGIDISQEAYADKEAETKLANSDFLNGLTYKEAVKKVISELEKSGLGKGKTNYRLRDAVFSRQRYWGEPFPVYYKNGIPHTIPEECLPLKLPEIEKYLPTETGEPPLGRADVWAWDEKECSVVSVQLADNKTVFPLELNTMPGWAGSSWYFFRYMEPARPEGGQEKRNEFFASKEAMDYWKNVDLYIGGSEHGTGHLLYARFWTKFLNDRNLVPVDEPFQKLINQGMILGESAFVYRIEGENKFVSKNLIEGKNVQSIHTDVSFVDIHNELDIEAFKNWRPEFKDAEFILEDGKYIVSREPEKMSKSKYNVVNPDDICEEYGADTLRMYEMFLGPLEQAKPWNTAGITGVHNFLKKLWKLYHSGPNGEFLVNDLPSSGGIEGGLKILHKTIKKVTEDIENFSFNTSISSLMICVNELNAQKCVSREVLEPLAVLISPFAPHIAEELWEKLGNSESVSTAEFPVYEEKFVVENTKKYPISFNGKVRFTMELALDLSKDEIEKTVMTDERTQKQLDGKTPKKVIVVPGKIVNIVG